MCGTDPVTGRAVGRVLCSGRRWASLWPGCGNPLPGSFGNAQRIFLLSPSSPGLLGKERGWDGERKSHSQMGARLHPKAGVKLVPSLCPPRV